MSFRRGLLAATIVLAAMVAVAYANPQVTLVLTNGQRVSGELVNNHNNEFGVLINGQEQSWPLSQVAVLEFAPGIPSQSELSQLMAVSNRPMENAIVLRNGQVVTGRLYDISNDGSTVTMDVDNASRPRYGAYGSGAYGSGAYGPPSNVQRQQFPTSEILRLYTAPTVASNLYASNATPSGVATSGYGPPPYGAPSGQPYGPPYGQPYGQRYNQAPAANLAISGNQQWTPTNIYVRAGDQLSFQASGEVHWGNGSSQVAGPDGANMPSDVSAGYPVPSAGVGALVGRVGNGQPFLIGANTQPVTMPASGQLFLGINDNELSDNSDGFQVQVFRQQ